MRRWRIVLVALVAGLLLLGPVVPGQAAPPPFVDAHGLTVARVNQLNSRTVDVTFETDALAAPTTARLLLPRNFDATGATPYPVLFLLHGGAADYRSWTELGGIAHILTENLPLITVMPDAGRSAWYTNWYNNGRGGPPMWETYHIEQLLPWVDANLPTIGGRSGRAIAGLSSGGFGAMSYASRHPDLFAAAAAFSGAVDTNTPPVLAGKVIDALALQDRGVPGSLFGIRELEEVRWRGSNPWDLAPNLRDMSIVLRTGDGSSGGEFGGGGPTDPGGMYLESACHRQSVSLHQRLDALGIDHLWDDYGPGTHNFHYWNRSLAQTLPIFMNVFAEERPDPTVFSYRSIEDTYSVYGWQVSIDRPVVEFSSFDDVSTAGFTLSGSGAGTVVSPPVYEPGRPYAVTLTGAFGTADGELVADDGGRLTIDVPLGDPNLVQQQFTPTHESPLTQVHTTTVNIDGPLGPTMAPTALVVAGDDAGQATTTATLAARLVTDAGAAVADAPLTFTFQGREHAAVTDGNGAAEVPVTVDGPAGAAEVLVSFAGDDEHLPSTASGPFTVEHADTSMTVSASRDGRAAVVRAELGNDHTGAGLAGRDVSFVVDGREVAAGRTAVDGTVEQRIDPAPRSGQSIEARFAGDDTFRAVAASTAWRGQGAPSASASSGDELDVQNAVARVGTMSATSALLIMLGVLVLTLAPLLRTRSELA